MKVGEALTAWRERHGRTNSDSRRLFWVSFGPLRIPVPHPGQLHWHDLHHIALGYEPDLIGEIEVSAFELRTGTPNVIVLFLCLAALLLGVFVAPLRTLRAFQRARGTQNLYACPVANADVLEWPIDELRSWMRIPPNSAPEASGPPPVDDP